MKLRNQKEIPTPKKLNLQEILIQREHTVSRMSSYYQ